MLECSRACVRYTVLERVSPPFFVHRVRAASRLRFESQRLTYFFMVPTCLVHLDGSVVRGQRREGAAAGGSFR